MNAMSVSGKTGACKSKKGSALKHTHSLLATLLLAPQVALHAATPQRPNFVFEEKG